METGSDKAAKALLCRAVELDGQKRKTEAVVCYLEGIQLLINHRKELKEVGGGSSTKISAYDAKAKEYMTRVEQLKSEIEDQKRAGKFHEQIKLDAGSTGNSYKSLFGRLLDEDVTQVEIEDPYIRAHHQIQNFLRLCELFVKSCKSLALISLVTTAAPNQPLYEEQSGKLEELKHDLQNNYGITLNVTFSAELHDREIRIIPNGWVVNLGRGLDIYKPAKGKTVIGQFDFDLRPCLETTIDIFHKSTIAKTKRKQNGAL